MPTYSDGNPTGIKYIGRSGLWTIVIKDCEVADIMNE